PLGAARRGRPARALPQPRADPARPRAQGRGAQVHPPGPDGRSAQPGARARVAAARDPPAAGPALPAPPPSPEPPARPDARAGRARCGAAPRAARSRDLIAADVDSRPRNGYPSRPLPWERRGATLGSWLVAEGAFA